MAASLYRELSAHASSNAAVIQIASLGSVARVLGRLATVLERWQEAEQHFESALGANERMGFHAWTAWTQLNYGAMLLRRAETTAAQPKDRLRAGDFLMAAQAFAQKSGMAKVQRDAEALLTPG